MGVAWPTAAFYYSTYTFSRLTYKLQLQLPTAEVRFEESRAHARVLSIPRQSIPPKIAQRLKALGLSFQLPEADVVSRASTLRAYAMSTWLADLLRDLNDYMNSDDQPLAFKYHHWLDNSICKAFERNFGELLNIADVPRLPVQVASCT